MMETCNQLRVVKKGECIECGGRSMDRTWMCDECFGHCTLGKEIAVACNAVKSDKSAVNPIEKLRQSVEGMTVEEMRIVLAMVAIH